MTLPKYIAERSTGASRSPSRQPRSFSIAIERFSPSVPAKAKVAQSTPAVTDWRVLISSSRAKLKIRMINREKTSMAEKSSRERNSARRSFQTTALTALMNVPEGRGRSRGIDFSSVVVLTILGRQCLLVESQKIWFLKFLERGGGRDHAA